MQRSPEQRLRLLDRVFLRFDELVGGHPGALKIETVGGVYLVAANSALLHTFSSSSFLSFSLFS